MPSNLPDPSTLPVNTESADGNRVVVLVGISNAWMAKAQAANSELYQLNWTATINPALPANSIRYEAGIAYYLNPDVGGFGVTGDPTVQPSTGNGSNLSDWLEVDPELVEFGLDIDRRSYVGPAIQWYSTDTGIWWDGIGNTWTKRIGGSTSTTGNGESLIEMGIEAARITYTGPAIQFYTTDTGIWWDGTDDAWTQRIGGVVGSSVTIPASTGDLSAASKAQLKSIWDGLDLDKISSGDYVDTDIAAFRALVNSVLL